MVTKDNIKTDVLNIISNVSDIDVTEVITKFLENNINLLQDEAEITINEADINSKQYQIIYNLTLADCYSYINDIEGDISNVKIDELTFGVKSTSGKKADFHLSRGTMFLEKLKEALDYSFEFSDQIPDEEETI